MASTRTRPTLRLASCASALLLTLAALATPAVATEPPASFHKSTTPLAMVDARLAATIDVEALRADDLVRDAEPGPMRYAGRAAAGWTLDDAGTWEELADGSRIWRLRIGSPGALSLSVALSDLDLPAGAKLWLYGLDQDEVQGPYTAADVKAPRFYTPVVLGDAAVLELHLPAAAARDDASLRVDDVHHGYRYFGETSFKQGLCNIDVVCPQGGAWRDQIRSVGTYSIQGTFLCTGTLMNNTARDFKPYFLTAEHCQLSTTNVSSMVVYWNYESPTCGALSGGSLTTNQTGATLVSVQSVSDGALALLDDQPDPSWNLYWAGWDARGDRPQAVTAIHHPGTDEKAISFENDQLDSVTILGYASQAHWRVNDWDLGTTEGGSSGSCIFDNVTGLCVGTLTGGDAACGNDDPDFYGKMSTHWTGGGTPTSRLSDWLDPEGLGTLFFAGGQPGPDDCGPDDLCLRGDRFQIDVTWRNFEGETGVGRVVTQSDDSGLLWFFGPDNWELLVKILDGCPINQHWWIFSAATTNVEYTLTVTDLESPNEPPVVYFNPLGVAAEAITDTTAFATCP